MWLLAQEPRHVAFDRPHPRYRQRFAGQSPEVIAGASAPSDKKPAARPAF
jgi:hypothetical protein